MNASHEFRNISVLVSSIMSFLEKIFGKDFLSREVNKLVWKPNGRPGEYKYLKEVNIHRATTTSSGSPRVEKRKSRWNIANTDIGKVFTLRRREFE